MGAAFGKVVTAFVEKMFAPVVGLILGGVNLAEKKWVLRAAEEGGRPEVAIPWTQPVYLHYQKKVRQIGYLRYLPY